MLMCIRYGSRSCSRQWISASDLWTRSDHPSCTRSIRKKRLGMWIRSARGWMRCWADLDGKMYRNACFDEIGYNGEILQISYRYRSQRYQENRLSKHSRTTRTDSRCTGNAAVKPNLARPKQARRYHSLPSTSPTSSSSFPGAGRWERT